MKKLDIEQLDFEKLDGIIPAIVQDAETKAVLMLGFMDKEALNKTIKNKKVTFWSRTKQKLWEKGETSGNTLEVLSIITDCDNDTLLILAKPQGPTCHTGTYSCFEIEKQGGLEFLQQLYDLIVDRKKDLPKNSYTASLFNQGLKKILEKVEEESGEVVQAAKKESKTRLIEESCDLLYHLFILLVQKKISLNDIIQELKHRKK
ncbi:bifunctional phosphoribosyl-AMP cyclohydrolase/phosphoribosyl-ATP diphosphatase HisIE [Patescibacteria group bacterium AH-259-L07]|nr:bifunctional phosphoribosyl-AMP cyclohydrolase/phosphoribosyl-ATP diphosphatase HisIE [Patescibacteria group bacterium AH-259-L07]